jgi:hypothetical protein
VFRPSAESTLINDSANVNGCLFDDLTVGFLAGVKVILFWKNLMMNKSNLLD